MKPFLFLHAGFAAFGDKPATKEGRFFVVDEFQDVSPVQRALLDAWRGSRSDICVVGDPNQTIYSFAGASSEHLLRFGDDFPNAITVTLDRNYRSTPEIVHLANSLVPDSPLELVSTIEGGLAPQLRSVSTDADEARAIAASIAANIAAGTKPEDIAILYRINSQSVALEAALAAAGVPFRVRGSRFFEEQTVRETMLILRGTAATNPTMTGEATAGYLAELEGELGALEKAGAALWPPERPLEELMVAKLVHHRECLRRGEVVVERTRIAAVVADPGRWRQWWPSLELTVFMDRGLDGVRWSITRPTKRPSTTEGECSKT